jgi:hypothetical protein
MAPGRTRMRIDARWQHARSPIVTGDVDSQNKGAPSIINLKQKHSSELEVRMHDSIAKSLRTKVATGLGLHLHVNM